MGWSFRLGRFGLVCLLTFTTLKASANGALPVDSPQVPPQVREAARSVLQLVVHWDSAFAYEKLNYQQTNEYLQKNCSTESHSFIQTKNCEAVRSCLATLTPSSAEHGHEPYLTSGSSWIAEQRGENTVIATNWHVLARQFAPQMFLARSIASYSQEERKRLLSLLTPIFSLYDAKGKLLYDSTAFTVGARIVEIGDILGAVYSPAETQGVANLIEDYLAIEVPLYLGSPLEIATKSPEEKEAAYALGYPVRTTGRKEVSDGHNLHVSPGYFYSPEQFRALVEPLAKETKTPEAVAEQTEQENAKLAKDYQLPNRGFVYASCDVIGGNSGGPLVNSKGQVVGMVSRTYSKEDRYEPAGSISLFAPHLPRAK